MATLARRRPRTALVAAVVGVALALTGCSARNPDLAGQAPTTSSSDGAFPVTIDAAYGAITIDDKPERILVLGPYDLELLLALGEQPVAISMGDASLAEQDIASTYPWLDGQYTGKYDPTLTTTDYAASAEVIASYDPDLILGNSFMIDEAAYAQLSQIAPTFTGRKPGEDPLWNEQLQALGKATGKSEKATSVIKDVDAQFAALQKRLPGLQGKSYNFITYQERSFRVTAFSNLDMLGVIPADNQPATHNKGNTDDFVSAENLDAELQADVLFVGTWAYPNTKTELEADPRFATLPASKNGTVLYLDITQTQALRGGPLGFTWWIANVPAPLENSALNRSGQ